MQRRNFLLTSTTAATAMAVHPLLLAQDMPSTIAIVMPVGGGTGADAGTRILADVGAHKLRRAVIVENKPGADTMIATQYVLNAPADGSRVLFLSPTNMVLLPLINKNLQFNPETQLQPIILSARGGAALIVKAGSKHKTLEEFVADAKAKPGEISLATYGGHYYKLLGLMLQNELGITLNRVPYKEPAPAINDVLGGNVDAMIIAVSGVGEFFRSSRINILAMTLERRPPAFRDAPTFKELGYPGLTAYIWIGYGVKSGTPPNVVRRLYQAFSAALKSPEYLSYEEKSNDGSELIDFDSEQSRAYIRQERKRFADLIEKTGYTMDSSS